jgi:hypothetical protein
MKISEKQIVCLEYLVWKSKDATNFARKCVIWMLRQTNRLSTPICITLPDKVAKEVMDGIHDMRSVNGTTHIGALFHAVGSDLIPDHCGEICIDRFGGSRDRKRLQPSIDEIRDVEPRSPYEH